MPPERKFRWPFCGQLHETSDRSVNLNLGRGHTSVTRHVISHLPQHATNPLLNHQTLVAVVPDLMKAHERKVNWARQWSFRLSYLCAFNQPCGPHPRQRKASQFANRLWRADSRGKVNTAKIATARASSKDGDHSCLSGIAMSVTMFWPSNLPRNVALPVGSFTLYRLVERYRDTHLSPPSR